MDKEIDFYNYLIFKNYDKNGYFKYGFYKKIMKWFLGDLSEYRFRKIFNNMVNYGMFFRIDTNGQKTYLYKLKVERNVDKKDIGFVEWI